MVKKKLSTKIISVFLVLVTALGMLFGVCGQAVYADEQNSILDSLGEYTEQVDIFY